MGNCIICDNPNYKVKYLVDSFKIVKCNRCGLFYLQNPLPLTNDTQTYEEYFKRSKIAIYEKNTSNTAMRTLWEINEQRLEWIKELKPGGSLLDIGSGRGYFLYHAALHGYQVEGVEISQLAAKYCEQQYHIKTYLQNIETELNIPRKYDIITLWHVLEHFTDPLQVLINLRHLLTEKGLLFIEVPNIYSLKFRLAPAGKKWIGGNHPRHHRFFFSRLTLSLLLTKAGYTIILPRKKAYKLSQHSFVGNGIKQLLKYFDLDSFINLSARS